MVPSSVSFDMSRVAMVLNWRKEKAGEDGDCIWGGLAGVLISEGVVTESQVAEGLAKAEKDGTYLGQALVQLKFIQPDDLVTCLVKKCRIPHLSLLDYDVSDSLVKLVSEDICKRFHLVPIDKMGKILTVAMVDPLNREALAVVKETCPDLKIKPILCDWSHYLEVTTRCFGTQAAAKTSTNGAVSLESLGMSKGQASPKKKAPESEPAPVEEAQPTPEKDETEFSDGNTAQAVAAAVREAMAEGLTGLQQGLENHAAQPAPAANGQDIAQAIRESMESVVEELRQDNKLADAAAQLTRAAEMAAQAIHAAQTLQSGQAEEALIDASAKMVRFTSVQAFGSNGNGNGQKNKADADARVRVALDADCPMAAFSFEDYCVSKANAFTVDLCKSLAESPGNGSNPFFLHGPVGIGKTHLINAIGNAIWQANNKARVGYVSAGRLAERLSEARQWSAADAFREDFSHWDVLILDDIQFLSGQVEAQEEFFHIFSALYQADRQIIIAADKPPDQLGHLEARLVSRFGGGIVAALEPPDHHTRMAILKAQAALVEMEVAEEVLAIIATRIPGDVRKMIGSLRKVIAFGKVVGQDITSDMAHEVLGGVDAAQAAQ
jgi:chromosomal replication initiator protein DnaA